MAARTKKTQSTQKKSAFPAAAVRKLGKSTDQAIARQFGVSAGAVGKQRISRGIPKADRSTINWTPKRLAMLGAMPDAKVAEKLGVTPNAIYQKRHKVGIAAFGKSTKQKKHKWTAKQVKMLGRLTDAQVAQIVGVSSGAVHQKRMVMGIDAPKERRRGRKPRRWTKRELAMLGKIPDPILARKLGIARNGIHEKRMQLGIPSVFGQQVKLRWTARRVAKLGKIPDSELAREIGVSTVTVSAFRRRRGIPACPRR